MTPHTLGYVLHVGHVLSPKNSRHTGSVILAGLPGAGTRETELTTPVAFTAADEMRRLGFFALHFPGEIALVLPRPRVDLADALNAAEVWRGNSGLKHVVFISLHYDNPDANVLKEHGGVHVAADSPSQGPALTVAGELVQSCPDVPLHLRFDTGEMWPVGPMPKAVSRIYLNLGDIKSQTHPAGARNMPAVGKWLGRALAEATKWV